jgi:D-alanyl-D-alanine carboxypeptidase/D-alanyl-D-alanine-endopeptidase (penicillin-binding protein 4)
MSGHVSQDSWQTVRQVPALQSGDVTERPPHVVFQERNSGTSPRGHGPVEALVVHRSEPLLLIAKSLNDYSNNIFNLWAESIGGATAVESVARNAVGADMRSEITLGDGAGADPRNRMSPRAAVRLLRALDEELHKTQHTLPDILPVAGIDAGTLKIRLSEPSEAGRVVGKTGTYGDYGASALVGAIATSDEGTVYFAILDHGLNVPEARARQDRFVRALLARLNSTPWDYHADLRAEVARVEAIARP